MKRDNDNQSGFSRRRFLQGAAGGAAATSALSTLPGLAPAAKAQATRSGLKRYVAAGADITLKVNGADKAVAVTPQTTLLHALRESLELTGAKEVCDRGACGACTVLVDGRSVNSCMMLAIDAVGSEITTVEGLKKGDQLDPRAAGVRRPRRLPVRLLHSRLRHAVAGAAWMKRRSADREEIKHGLCGNICRCAAYVRIFDAVEAAAKGGRR